MRKDPEAISLQNVPLAPSIHLPARKITSRDVPLLLEALACEDTETTKEALRLLCPCRNRRYDRQVWTAIFRLYREANGAGVRDQAGHAIDTLRERARTDPRSQDLLQWLADQGLCAPPTEMALSPWEARAPGLYIPRWEHSPRSRANRRRK